MRKQWIALLLAAALALSLCAVPALAQTEEETEKPAGETAAGETAAGETAAGEETAGAEPAAGEESAGEAALPEEDGKPIVVLPEEPSGGTAADSTMGQSTADSTADAPMVAIAVWATVLTARMPAALNHSHFLLFLLLFSLLFMPNLLSISTKSRACPAAFCRSPEYF